MAEGTGAPKQGDEATKALAYEIRKALDEACLLDWSWLDAQYGPSPNSKRMDAVVRRSREVEARIAAALAAAPPAESELLRLADAACGDLADNAAHDLDHGGYVHPKWYRAVKRYRKARAKAEAR